MKKTLTINISGNIFHIDEDAYEKLNLYIQKLKKYYTKTEEGEEIIHDIEARIAEIFIENLSEKTEVVDIKLVEKLICILGKPEEIFDEEDLDDTYTEEPNKDTKQKEKKSFYRNPTNKILGGVASGISSYLGINVSIIRLIFLLTFIFGYGSPFIIYIILWIVIPSAVSASQRLEMQGKKINIKNIDKHIKDEYNYIKDEFSNFKKNESIGSKIEKLLHILDPIIKLVLKVFIILIGIWFIFMGIMTLIGLTGSIFFTSNYLDFDFNSNLINLFINSQSLSLFSIALGVSIFIPVILIIFLGLKIIFRFKSKNKIILISAFCLWLIGITTLSIVSLSQVSEFRTKASQITKTECIGLSNYNSISIKAIDNKEIIDFDQDLIFDSYNIIHTDNEELIAGKVSFDIKKSNNDKVELEIHKTARGKNYDTAKDNSININYSWNETDSIIALNNYFVIQKDNKWRKQKIDMTLLIPVGQIVYLDNSLHKIISDIKNTNNTWDLDMLEKKWIMKKDGLTEY